MTDKVRAITFSLDEDTIRILRQVSVRWGVSSSALIRLLARGLKDERLQIQPPSLEVVQK